MDRDLGLVPTRFSWMMHKREGSCAQPFTYRGIAKRLILGVTVMRVQELELRV